MAATNDKVKLLSGLLSILSNPARTIATSNSLSRKASVALIIRLRPAVAPTTPSTSTSSSPTTSAPSSPLLVPSFGSHLELPPTTTTPSPLPSSSYSTLPPPPPSPSAKLHHFFSQPWVQDPTTIAECLFIKRVTRSGDRWSGDVALPGGKAELEDESGQYTAMRETWEEVGLDLAEDQWVCVGNLDDREITTSLGKRLLMILSPYVFLNTSPYTPPLELQAAEIASAHWIPLDLLQPPKAKYGTVGIDISSRLAPRSPLAQFALRLLVGSMYFRCILLPNEPELSSEVLKESRESEAKRADLRLWGLTLGMALDLLSKTHLPLPSSSPFSTLPSSTSAPLPPPSNLSTYPHATLDLPPMSLSGAISPRLSPSSSSVASIFPRFSYADINVLIYLFGWRYRRLLSLPPTTSASSQSHLAQIRGASAGGADDMPGDQRVNYAGVALGSYYASVRKALVVAVALRALGAIVGMGWIGVWAARKWKENRRRASA